MPDEKDKQETKPISGEAAPADDKKSKTDETVDQDKPKSDDQQPKTVTLEIPEDWEYNGDRKNVPKPLEKYIKNLDRYVSKKDQTLAETKKKLEEYESVVNSDSYKQFQEQSKQDKNEQEPLFTQDEMDAISLGDAKTFQKVLDKAVDRKLASDPNRETIEKLSKRDRLFSVKENMDSFAKIHPDFNELVDSPVGEYMIDAAKQGIGLEKIYENAKNIEKYMTEKVEKTRVANLEAKKKGSSVKNTVAGTPDIVWAKDDEEARRIALELQLKKDPRVVRIKPKE